MSTVKFLSQLRGLGVKLWMDGERLRVKAPAGVLTKALKKDLAAQKEDIVRFLNSLKEGDSTKEKAVETERVTPLSLKQQYIWLRDRINVDDQVNHLAFAVRISGALDKAVLEKSIAKVTEHHEILRTSYPVSDSLPTLKVSETLKPQLKVINLKHLRKSEREDAARNRAVEESNRPIDTETGPLARWVLMKLSDEDHIFLTIMHRIIADDTSKDIFLNELNSAYQAITEGDETKLAEQAITVATFAEKEREWLESPDCKAQTEYWKKILEDHQRVPDLPTDTPRSDVRTHAGATLHFDIPDTLVTAVSKRANAQSQSFHDTLLTAFSMLVGRYTGDNEISIGVHRRRPDWQDTSGAIGPFANEVVIRTNLNEGADENPSFQQCLGNVAKTVAEAADNADLPFEKLAAELQLDIDLSRGPLIQILFDYQDDRQVPSPVWPDFPVESRYTDYDIAFQLTHNAQGLGGKVLYNNILFNRDRVERMIGHYLTVLENTADDPNHKLLTVPLLTQSESGQILEDWNQTTTQFEGPQLLHQLFEAKVAANPDGIVLESGSGGMTFAELNTLGQ